MFIEIKNQKIPLVTTGTSPFIGAGQFGKRGIKWRKKYLNNTEEMVNILEVSYQSGARGIEAIPIGNILEAARVMDERYEDYVVTGSTYPGKDPGIEDLIDAGAKLIFVHGMVSDKTRDKMESLMEQITTRGVLAGIATHDPVHTIEYALNNSVDVKAFLIPFNYNGTFMGNQTRLEEIIDSKTEYNFIGMKTLAAGSLDPEIAYEYISSHNICAVSIGMVTIQEAEITTEIALKKLQK